MKGNGKLVVAKGDASKVQTDQKAVVKDNGKEFELEMKGAHDIILSSPTFSTEMERLVRALEHK